MEGLRYPVGDLPPQVYWRRRMVALAGMVLLALVLYYLIRGMVGGGAAGPGATPSPSTSATPGPSSSASPGPTASPGLDADLATARACSVDDLSVAITPSATSYPGTTAPLFAVEILQTGATACAFDPGEDAELLIWSGRTASPDRIWNSGDCEGSGLFVDAAPSLLGPNDSLDLSMTWPRVRSNQQCATGLPAPLPGWYHAVLTVVGAESNDSMFALES